jgi:anaerobic magnesium-protoporphyrin IX monomethyl ester cyclase
MLDNQIEVSRVLLINPPSLFDPKDPFTTGIVYMPIGLAYLAANLRESNIDFQVIDAFGLAPKNSSKLNDFVRLGLDNNNILQQAKDYAPNIILVYANQVLNHDALIELIRDIRLSDSSILIGVLENSQAVTAYKVNVVAEVFFEAGIDFLVSGELEIRVVELLRFLESRNFQLAGCEIDGISRPGSLSEPKLGKASLDALATPLWELFPLKSYWSLDYAHGPKTRTRYLPMLTSRGCPFSCDFCVVPSVTQRKWNSRSPKSIYDEMLDHFTRFSVDEFHLEDLNPTINEDRMVELAKLIIESGHSFVWKIAAGTKIETIKNLETFELLAESGLKFISMSPESGSYRVQKMIGKSFDKPYGIQVTKVCRRNDIAIQACFVLGFPGETNLDLLLTYSYICQLTWAGLDEVALFIVAPIPGSNLSARFANPNESLSELNFSPKWRSDYRKLFLSRILMYGSFLIIKFLRHPFEVMRFVRNLLTRNFRTKMEMTLFRGIILSRIARKIQSS